MNSNFGSAALGLFGLAARLLGWRPVDFWAATPAELAAALAPPGGPSDSVDRTELEQLMEQDNG